LDERLEKIAREIEHSNGKLFPDRFYELSKAQQIEVVTDVKKKLKEKRNGFKHISRTSEKNDSSK
jgi:hypothetical protein